MLLLESNIERFGDSLKFSLQNTTRNIRVIKRIIGLITGGKIVLTSKNSFQWRTGRVENNA